MKTQKLLAIAIDKAFWYLHQQYVQFQLKNFEEGLEKKEEWIDPKFLSFVDV